MTARTGSGGEEGALGGGAHPLCHYYGNRRHPHTRHARSICLCYMRSVNIVNARSSVASRTRVRASKISVHQRAFSRRASVDLYLPSTLYRASAASARCLRRVTRIAHHVRRYLLPHYHRYDSVDNGGHCMMFGRCRLVAWRRVAVASHPRRAVLRCRDSMNLLWPYKGVTDERRRQRLTCRLQAGIDQLLLKNVVLSPDISDHGRAHFTAEGLKARLPPSNVGRKEGESEQTLAVQPGGRPPKHCAALLKQRSVAASTPPLCGKEGTAPLRTRAAHLTRKRAQRDRAWRATTASHVT